MSNTLRILMIYSFGSNWLMLNSLSVEATKWVELTESCKVSPEGTIHFFAKYGFYPCSSKTCPLNQPSPFKVNCQQCCYSTKNPKASFQRLTKNENESNSNIEKENKTGYFDCEHILILLLCLSLTCGVLVAVVIAMALYIKRKKKTSKIRSIRDDIWRANNYLPRKDLNGGYSSLTKKPVDNEIGGDNLVYLTTNRTPITQQA